MPSLKAAKLLAAILALTLAGHSIPIQQQTSIPDARAQQAEKLVLAARDNDISAIKMLIDQGVDINIRSARGTTALMVAAAAGSVDAVRFLIAARADVNARAPHGKTALSMTIEYFTPNHSESNKDDFVSVVKELIAAGADIRSKDENGLTPLLWAAAVGNEDMTRVLIDAGAGVNMRTRVRIRPRQYLTVTPLIYSIINCTDEKPGAIGVVRLLLERGADATAKDSRGRTALRWAEKVGDADIINTLRK
jgi:ankyrin repeat protein